VKSSKRVLGIVASPHNSGNTATLVKEVLKGTEERGYETDLKCLGDLKINPLITSASDKPYGVGGPKDDMKLIHSSLEKMNTLVFGTPIYYDHVSARAKIFIDRLIYYNKESRKNLFPKNTSAIIIVTYEWDKPEASSLQAENTVKNPVANREDLLKKARQMGRNL